MSYRLRLQGQQELDESQIEYKMRNKIGIEYDAPKKWTPTAFVEHYLSADAQDKIQIGLGTKYKLNKRNRLAMRLVWETFLNTTPDNIIIILGYEFRAGKKKK